jgi:hypothetical protein
LGSRSIADWLLWRRRGDGVYSMIRAPCVRMLFTTVPFLANLTKGDDTAKWISC